MSKIFKIIDCLAIVASLFIAYGFYGSGDIPEMGLIFVVIAVFCLIYLTGKLKRSQISFVSIILYLVFLIYAIYIIRNPIKQDLGAALNQTIMFLVGGAFVFVPMVLGFITDVIQSKRNRNKKLS